MTVNHRRPNDVAAQKCHIDVARLLLDKGAQIDKTDKGK